MFTLLRANETMYGMARYQFYRDKRYCLGSFIDSALENLVSSGFIKIKVRGHDIFNSPTFLYAKGQIIFTAPLPPEVYKYKVKDVIAFGDHPSVMNYILSLEKEEVI